MTGLASCALIPDVLLTTASSSPASQATNRYAHFAEPSHLIPVRLQRFQQRTDPYVSNGFNNEQIHILCHPTRYYNSLQQHLQLMSRPNAYAGYIEIAAGQQLYNVSINVIVAGTAALPSVPHPPFHDNVRVLYHPQSMHYSTLAPNYFEVLITSFCIIIALQLFFLILLSCPTPIPSYD